jgi:hypothetical protein
MPAAFAPVSVVEDQRRLMMTGMASVLICNNHAVWVELIPENGIGHNIRTVAFLEKFGRDIVDRLSTLTLFRQSQCKPRKERTIGLDLQARRLFPPRNMRMSTEHQKYSTTSQSEANHIYAASHGMEIVLHMRTMGLADSR